MTPLRCLAIAVVLGLGGCALRPTSGAALTDPADAPERLIVVTVANPPEAIAVQAGSTPRGYDLAPAYAEGEAARITLRTLARDYHLRAVAQWPIAPLQVHCAVFALAPDASPEAVLAQLARDPRVQLAEPLHPFHTLSSRYNDPYFRLQSGFVRIEAPQAQDWSVGEGVRIALVDTGVDLHHPDLQGRIRAWHNLVDDDDARFTADRHGTEVAGVIAANANNATGIVGMAPAAHIIALKACWQLPPDSEAAQCNTFTLAKALAAALAADARIINLSLGGPRDALLEQLLRVALQRGIIVVGALPPDGHTDGFPLGVAGVIGVDASGRGAEVPGILLAPGREVLTLVPGGHYDFASGSSLAAAHVTGALALLLAQDAHLSAGAAGGLLERTSVRDAGGTRMINVCAALAALRGGESCGPEAVAR